MEKLKTVIEIQKENVANLLELIKAHPDLPVVPMVDSEIVADDGYSWWLGSWGSASVQKYTIHNEHMIFWDDGVDDIFDEVFVWDDVIPDNATEEQEEEIRKDAVNGLDWVEAITVRINLPN